MNLKCSLILFSLVVTINAYSQSWQWSRHIASSYQGYGERINNIFCDGNSIYTVGAFGGTLIFTNDTLFSNGHNNIFMAKFDAGGNVVWLRTFGGSSISPAILENGFGAFDTTAHQFYISGTFYGTADFGNGVSLTSAPNSVEDAFIAKFDTNGVCQWARLISSPGSDRAYCFVQPDGNILTAGRLASNGYIGQIPVDSGGFFARFDPFGNVLWAEKKFYGPEKYALDIAFINSDICINGVYDINTASIDTAILPLIGQRNGFLARLDSAGKTKWVQTFSGPGSNGGASIFIDLNSDIYVSGSYEDSIQLDIINLIDTGKDFFLAKFNSTGNILWAQKASADSTISGGASICGDNDGNSYIIGSFNGNAHFGNFTISTTLPYDMFIAKYSYNGSCIGVKHFGQASGFDLSIDGIGNIIGVGIFRNTVNIGGSIYSATMGQDIFIAKLDEITGIEEINGRTGYQLLIYANPNAGKCSITVPDDFLNEKNLTLSIFNNSGQLIQQQPLQMNEGKIKVNLSAEAKGIYSVTLSNGTKVYYGKIVFE